MLARFAGAEDSACIGKGKTGIESFVHQVVVAAAVELIAAGLHREIEVTAADLSVFRREVAGLD